MWVICLYPFNPHNTPRCKWHFLLHFSEEGTEKQRGSSACSKSGILQGSEPGPEPLALESVLSPAQGFSVCNTKVREGLPLHLVHCVTPSKHLHSHQRAKSNINVHFHDVYGHCRKLWKDNRGWVISRYTHPHSLIIQMISLPPSPVLFPICIQ